MEGKMFRSSSSSSSSNIKGSSKKKLSSKKLGRFLKEQRARLYIARRCINEKLISCMEDGRFKGRVSTCKRVAI
ncbi:OLC1v1009958C1 [Oldenlandia corymbosa var. corymbosa]|uniref:OLC1v1009958C1 n=1 Tax=Oldenlandia corymbosa var. corymbosa TaxID=529605 RepID=A0AAV1DQD4_OLDCO|nr:OLC1v1009958C1 [Oldenlandia corymbosa var. corymbosa]